MFQKQNHYSVMNYEVVHSTTGRLRIRVPQLSWDHTFAQTLNRLVKALAFVTMVRINPAARSLVVIYEPTRVLAVTLQEQIAICIDKARPMASLMEEEEHIAAAPVAETELEPEVNRWQDLGMPCLSLGVALLATPLELPVLLVTATIAGAALPWFIRAADSLVNHRQPNIDLLDSLWMTMQTVQGQYAASALKTCLVEVRRALRGTTAHARHQEGSEILAQFAQDYWVERSGEHQRVTAQSMQSGDRLKLRAGDWIPVDGWILQGTALIDESWLTGASQPVVCSEGQAVYAGGWIVAGDLEILAERTGAYTRIGIVAHHLQEPPVHDTQIGTDQAEFLRSMIFPTIVFGGAVFALTGNIGVAISPFQLDFGSGIPISVHSTLLLALTEAARQGIYIRNARILELLAQLDGVVFDQRSLIKPGESHPQTVWQESATTIATLKQQGITVYWITPDDADVAQAHASFLGIPPHHVWAEASPEQSIALTEALQHQGKTIAYWSTDKGRAMPGSVKISLAQAGEHPPEADVVLLDHDVQGLLHALTIASRAIEVVYENTAIIVAPNLLVQIGGGMILGMNPVINVITNNSSAFVSEFIHGNKPLFNQPLHLTSQRRSRKVPPPSTEEYLQLIRRVVEGGEYYP
jgi:cation transport ATPase